MSLGPLADAVLEGIATAGAAYYVLMRNPSVQETERGNWIDRFRKRADDLLRMIAMGSASLPLSGTTESGLIIWSSTMNFVPTFGQLPLEYATVDVDRVLNELDAKGSGLSWVGL